MPDFKELLQNMTSRLILIQLLIFFGVQQGLFANTHTGFELYYFEDSRFKPWQFLTHLFLHRDYIHLAFNLVAIWFLGRALESQWGGTRFVIFYIACGVGAAIISLFVDYLFLGPYWGASIGASGVVYGLMTAFVLNFPDFKFSFIFIPTLVAAKHVLLVLLLIDLIAGMTGFSIFGSNIAHFSHLGGALMGFLMVQLFKRAR